MPDEKHQVEKPQLDWNKVKGFAFQTMTDIGTAMHGALSFIGDRLGIFKAIAGAGWVSSTELAERTGLSERYLREWLGAMAAARYVEYDPATRKFMTAARARDDPRQGGLAVFLRRLYRRYRQHRDGAEGCRSVQDRQGCAAK